MVRVVWIEVGVVLVGVFVVRGEVVGGVVPAAGLLAGRRGDLDEVTVAVHDDFFWCPPEGGNVSYG